MKIAKGHSAAINRRTCDCHWKSMESWVGKKQFSLLQRLQCAYSLFFKSTNELFIVQGARHFPNKLPTMVHGQAFCSITW